MKYLVTIDYNHKKGFEMSEDMVVVAPDQEGAISYLSGLLSSRASVKSIARTRAISIEPIESPAPTDWGKELDGIKKTTLAAYQFIKQSIINSSDMPYDMREIELADAVGVYTHVCLRWWPSEATGELRAYLKNRFREKESVWSCDAARIVEIAESVQKAIAGGTWK